MISPIDKDHLQSQVINYLRFPLIIGVLFIHNSDFMNLGENIDIEGHTYESITIIIDLFSNTLASVAVPIFFFISGFLFFYRLPNFTLSLYKTKLLKRINTLLIPYLFWNLLLFLVYLLASKLTVIKALFNTNAIDSGLFSALLGIPSDQGMTYPIVYPFWFIRDLMVCVIISPILFFIITKTRHIGIILLGIAWYIGFKIPYLGYRGFSTTALFFFSLGAWFSCYNKNIIVTVRELKFFGIIYPLVIIAEMLTKHLSINPYIHSLGIVSGAIFWFLIASYLIEIKKLKPIPILTSASFFIFAIHEPWLLVTLRKLTLSLLHPTSPYIHLLLYFATIAIVTFIAIGIYYVLKKIAPKFTNLITGNR
ncbi:MAG: acyltransferase [Muribaculaceae bacterium]|nr:acyltransferase [Muribaculaceae bacterium]